MLEAALNEGHRGPRSGHPSVAAPIQAAAVPGHGASRRAGAMAARLALALMAFAVPLDVMPLFGSSSITAAIGGLLALAAAWHVASTGRARAPPAMILLLSAYAAWAAASLLWVMDLTPSLARLMTVLQLVAFVWLGWQVARTRLDLRLLLGGLLAGCTVVAAGAWRSFLGGVTVVEMAQEQVVDFEDPRYAAVGFDPNDMGVTLALGIPVAVYLALIGERRLRALWFAYLPLALSAIALSGSRGAMLTAAAAVACVLFFTGRRSLVAAGATAALVAAGGLTVWWLKPETWDRFYTFRQQLAGGSLGDRVPIWRAGWEVLCLHPVAGVGIGGFPDAVAPYLTFQSTAHNTLLSVAVELGLTGTLLFAGALLAGVLAARRSAPLDRELLLGLLVTWAIGVSSLTWEYRKTTWLLFLVGSVVAALPPDGDDHRAGRGRPHDGAQASPTRTSW